MARAVAVLAVLAVLLVTGAAAQQTVTLSADPAAHDGVDGMTVTAVFSSSVVMSGDDAFSVADLTVSNGVASALAVATPNTTFTFTMTPSGSGAMTVSLPTNKVKTVSPDVYVQASNTLTIYDYIPRVTITPTDGNVGTHDGSTAIPLQVSFTVPVSATGDGTNDFTKDDLTITGGTLTGDVITEGTGANVDRVWTFSVTPSGTDNVVVSVYGNVATATNGGNWNVPVDSASVFMYTTQWGLLQVVSLTPDPARGDSPGTLTTNVGTSTATLSAESYKFAEYVTVCLQRIQNPSASSAAVAGDLRIKVELASGESDVTVSVTGNEVHSDVTDQGIGVGDSFYLDWNESELADAERCFEVKREDPSNDWVTAALSLCDATDDMKFEFTADHSDVSTANCASGSGSGCADGNRFFVDGMDKLTITKTATQNPPIKVLPVDEVADLFVTGSGPPDPNRAMYAQDEPYKLLVFERTCTGDVASAADGLANLWTADTTLALADLLDDTTASPGLDHNANTKFADLTSRYTAITTKTWDDGSDSLLGSNQVQMASAAVGLNITWAGAECGSSHRKFIGIQFHDGDGNAELDATEQAVVDFDVAVTGTNGATCATNDYETQTPGITFTVRNDATRATDALDESVTVAPVDLRYWSSNSIVVDGNDIGISTGSRLHVNTENPAPERALHIHGVGSCIPKTGAGFRFEAANLATMCVNLADSFEDDMVVGTVSQDALFDALFVEGDYQSVAVDNSAYSSSVSAPFYPTGGNNPLLQNGGQFVADAYEQNNGANLFNVLNGESVTGKFGARYDWKGTLTEFQACKDYLGNDVVDITNNDETGITQYTITMFHQVIGSKGTNTDDRDWEEMSCETSSYTVTFANDMVGMVGATTDKAEVAVDLVSVQAETCTADECKDESDGTTSLINTGSAHYCNCGSSCDSVSPAPIYKRLRIQVLMDIERTASASSGDIGVRPTYDVPLKHTDSSDDTCYGLNVTPKDTSVVFQGNNHENSATTNRFMITYYTECLNMYNNVLGKNSDDGFSACENALYTDNFDFAVALKRIVAAHTPWEHADANKFTTSAFTDVATVDVRVRFYYRAPLTTVDLSASAAGFTANTVELYLDPDALENDVKVQKDRQPLSDANLDIKFNAHDNVVITHRLTHAAFKNKVVLHIRDAIVCSLNPRSAYHDCVHPRGTPGSVAAGGIPTQSACPTGANAYLQYSCDATAWRAFLGTGSISPISSAYYFVQEYTPLQTFDGAADVHMCRYSVKTTAQKDRPGTTAFFCNDWNNSPSHNCGENNADFLAVKQSTSSAVQWDNLGNDFSGSPVSGQDAVEIPLEGLPSDSINDQEWFISVRSTTIDCSDGSEHDGARLLRGAASERDNEVWSLSNAATDLMDAAAGRKLSTGSEEITDAPEPHSIASASPSFSITAGPNNIEEVEVRAAGGGGAGGAVASGSSSEILGLPIWAWILILVGALLIGFFGVRKARERYSGYVKYKNNDEVDGLSLSNM